MRISDWSSDVCSSDLRPYQVDDLLHLEDIGAAQFSPDGKRLYFEHFTRFDAQPGFNREWVRGQLRSRLLMADVGGNAEAAPAFAQQPDAGYTLAGLSPDGRRLRSEEHTSELQSLMRISYAVFCLKKDTYEHTCKLCI